MDNITDDQREMIMKRIRARYDPGSKLFRVIRSTLKSGEIQGTADLQDEISHKKRYKIRNRLRRKVLFGVHVKHLQTNEYSFNDYKDF
jgi:hypothetical protein